MFVPPTLSVTTRIISLEDIAFIAISYRRQQPERT